VTFGPLNHAQKALTHCK